MAIVVLRFLDLQMAKQKYHEGSHISVKAVVQVLF